MTFPDLNSARQLIVAETGNLSPIPKLTDEQWNRVVLDEEFQSVLSAYMDRGYLPRCKVARDWVGHAVVLAGIVEAYHKHIEKVDAVLLKALKECYEEEYGSPKKTKRA